MGMLDQFLAAAGLNRTFGPQQNDDAYMGMPAELPTRGTTGPTFPNAGVITPGATQEPYPGYDEEVFAEVEEPMSTLEAFKQNVLNPPKRRHMTYPKNTLAGLDAALKIAATPTDFEKNRVFVNGDPYQQVKVWTDPATGEKKFINKYKQPGFMEQVLKAMPAAVSPAVDILNQQREDEMADWDLKNKGLAAVSKAESDQALAEQRRATATTAIPAQAAARLRTAEAALSRANTAERLSLLKDLTDSERLELLSRQRITEQEYKDAASMARVVEQQRGATERTGMQQTGATERTGMTTASAERRTAASNASAERRVAAQQAGATERTGMTTASAERRTAAQQAGASERNAANIESRLKLKQTPSAGAGSTAQLPTQQIKAAQLKATEAIQDHPEWEDYLSIDQNGMVHIDPPSTSWYDPGPDKDTYNEIKNYLRSGMPASTAAPPAPKPTTTTPPATTKPPTTTTKPAPSKNTTTPPKAPDTSPKKDTVKLTQAATDLLKQNNQPVTQANIDYVIKQGMVK